MTRIELERYGDLCRQIEVKRNLLAEVRSSCHIVSDTVKGSDRGYPFVAHTIIIRGPDRNEGISGEEKQLLDEIAQLQDNRDKLRQRIEIFLQELPGEHRTILDLTYIKGWSQRKVGDIVGYDASTICRILKKY